ncbi:unnamed protein product [Moneuplotes crassus]|uniref:Uncharacterized protein n=1 Tax=Euplotes crassus TaxID=5936 RepID=A0AAD1UL46_EUPCR|nr:unnamed protein product [Moneuplotes crassus]
MTRSLKTLDIDNSAQNKDVRSAKIRVEENLKQQSENIDSQVFFSLREKYYGRSFYRYSDFELTLDLSRYHNAQLMESVTFLSLHIYDIRTEHLPSLRKFLCNSSWRRVQELNLSFHSSVCFNKSKCLKSVLNASYKVKSKVWIRNTTISQSSLMKLLSACRNTKELIFQNCEIFITKVPNFGHSLDGSIIESLRLKDCRINGSARTKTSTNGLSKLVEGLSKSLDFREASKEFKCLIDEREFSQILREHG